MITQEILTPLGIIDGRDAIILKKLETRIYPNEVVCFVEIDSHSCSDYQGADEFVNYKIQFDGVISYSLYSTDCFPHENSLKSSFDKVLDSDLLKKYNIANKFTHIILSCYDHIIEVVCESYSFDTVTLNN